jgi:regulator of PEP synthase PpsR (kinase-PPPase family)
MAPARSEVFVVSDGTGETCAAAVRAAMLQFRTPWRLRIFAGVRTAQEARRVVQEAADVGALVVFSLVDGASAEAVMNEARRREVGVVDLLGPLIDAASAHLQADPRKEPGLLHGISDDYFRRVEAVEFAVRHDDGANARTLYQADLVLTGVSRTSKTPLSMYLAQRGYKTGNVPLVPGLDPPLALLELEPRKVFALDIDSSTLLEVRQARVRTLGSAPYSAYADAERVLLELDRARRMFRQRGWRIVNVSGRAVEENAARIVELYESTPPRAAGVRTH